MDSVFADVTDWSVAELCVWCHISLALSSCSWPGLICWFLIFGCVRECVCMRACEQACVCVCVWGGGGGGRWYACARLCVCVCVCVCVRARAHFVDTVLERLCKRVWRERSSVVSLHVSVVLWLVTDYCIINDSVTDCCIINDSVTGCCIIND